VAAVPGTALANVSEYRAFILGQDGHIFKAEGFEASDDEEALRKAKCIVDGHDVEVWQLARKVAAIKAVKDEPSRTEQAQQVAEEYAADQRDIIKALRSPAN
jgi:hypothetical protein